MIASGFAAFYIGNYATSLFWPAHSYFLLLVLISAYLLQVVLFLFPLIQLVRKVWENKAEPFKKNQLTISLIVALPILIQSFIAPPIWKSLWIQHATEAVEDSISLLLGLNVWIILLLIGHLSYQVVIRNKK